MHNQTVGYLRARLGMAYSVSSNTRTNGTGRFPYIHTNIIVNESFSGSYTTLAKAFEGVAMSVKTPWSAFRDVVVNLKPTWRFWQWRQTILQDLYDALRNHEYPTMTFIPMNDADEITISTDHVPAVKETWYVAVSQFNSLTPGIYAAEIKAIHPYMATVDNRQVMKFNITYWINHGEGEEPYKGSFYYDQSSDPIEGIQVQRTHWTIHHTYDQAVKKFDRALSSQIDELEHQRASIV